MNNYYYEKLKLKWYQCKNPRAKGKEAYKPTSVENYANTFTHGIAIIPSILAAFYLVSYAKSNAQYNSVLVYGISLIMLFSISTLYHTFSCLRGFEKSSCRSCFHYFDRGAIYIFIASSYTPWLYLRYGDAMCQLVWIGAFFGIIYQIIFHEKYKILEVVFYLIIGICPSFLIINLVDVSGLRELAISGFFYIIGIIFFKSDGIIPGINC